MRLLFVAEKWTHKTKSYCTPLYSFHSASWLLSVFCFLMTLFLLELIHHCCRGTNERKFLCCGIYLPAEEPKQQGCFSFTFVSLHFGGLLFGESILLMLRRAQCPEAGSLPVVIRDRQFSKRELLNWYFLALNGDFWNWMNEEPKQCSLIKRAEGWRDGCFGPLNWAMSWWGESNHC